MRNYFSQGPTYGNKMFLKVNLYSLFHCYEEVEGYPGSGGNISIEKVNIHNVLRAPQQICYETIICFTPIFLKVCGESSSTCPNSWVKMLFLWDIALHHPVSDHSVIHQSRHFMDYSSTCLPKCFFPSFGFIHLVLHIT